MGCSKCGAENPDRAKFCGECASPLTRRCPSCDTENSPIAKFCIECAQPLEAKATPPTANAASARQARDGERRHLTVLFCDLVDSTEIAGRLDPEDWRDIAAQYQETSAAAVTRFGGHVAKYLGDGLMVYSRQPGYPKLVELVGGPFISCFADGRWPAVGSKPARCLLKRERVAQLSFRK